MKAAFIALGVTAATTMNLVAPALAQAVIYENRSSDVYSDQDGTESNFLQNWNRRHDSLNRWGTARNNFGPDDVIRLLERRGYRVKNVRDVGPRYLVKASRGDDDLLVSVSRRGEVMGVVHDER